MAQEHVEQFKAFVLDEKIFVIQLLQICSQQSVLDKSAIASNLKSFKFPLTK